MRARCKPQRRNWARRRYAACLARVDPPGTRPRPRSTALGGLLCATEDEGPVPGREGGTISTEDWGPGRLIVVRWSLLGRLGPPEASGRPGPLVSCPLRPQAACRAPSASPRLPPGPAHQSLPLLLPWLAFPVHETPHPPGDSGPRGGAGGTEGRAGALGQLPGLQSLLSPRPGVPGRGRTPSLLLRAHVTARLPQAAGCPGPPRPSRG